MRIDLAQPIVGEAKRGKCSRLEVGEHGIGGRHQALEHVGAVLGCADSRPNPRLLRCARAKDSLIAWPSRFWRSPSG